MNLLISTNYNISEEKWSISLKYWDIIKSVSLERITRIKYFPSWEFFWRKNYYKIFILWVQKLIKWLDLESLDEIITLNFPFSLELLFVWKKIKYLECKEHHLLHAFSSFYSSWFSESIVLIIDWAWFEEKYNKEICYSIWKFSKDSYENLYIWEIEKSKFKLWIWYIYALHTLIFWIGEWAIMWLSSYGNPDFYKNIDLFWEDFFLKDKYREIFKKHQNNWWNLNDLKNAICEIYWIKDREIDKDFINNNYKNIASRLQYCTENVILNLSKKAKDLSWSDNLCIAWWVWLNIIWNTLILKENIFKNIFVEPASDDSWLSLWWIYYLQSLDKKNKSIKLESYWLWQEYDNSQIVLDLNKYKDYLSYKKCDDIYSIATEKLANSKIIWFFQWWSELWPRALGFRSILARPDSLKIRNKINKIKNREYWRPLAPVILEDELENYFKTKFISPFMLFNSEIKKDKFSKMIWISHVDFSARYQTLNSKNNPFLHKLLTKFNKTTNIPILVNTSFNQHNEPIVETPREAIEMFLSTELDYLIIWDFIVSKEKIFSEFTFSEEKSYWKLFNRDDRILEKLNNYILKEINFIYRRSFKKWKIEFENDKDKFSISLVEFNVIWNKKNILLNFETKINREEKEKIIKNLKINKNFISKLLLTYYNDFIEENNVVDIIIENNNFKL